MNARLGAPHFSLNPLDRQHLEREVARPGEESGLAAEDAETATRIFWSSNARILHIRSICDRVAHADVPVLILGESGVGKEVLAEYIQIGRASCRERV